MEDKEKYIDTINYYHDILGIVKEYHYDYYSINEYDSVYQDILDYEDNEYEDFKTDKDFVDFINYLKSLIISGLEEKR